MTICIEFPEVGEWRSDDLPSRGWVGVTQDSDGMIYAWDHEYEYPVRVGIGTGRGVQGSWRVLSGIWP